MVGAVTTLGVWAVSLPFGALQLWWGRRYGLERQGYVAWALAQWPALLGQVVGLTIALTVLLLLAGRFGRRWWLVAAPLFVAVGAVLVLVLPWAETLGTRPPHDTPAAARIRQLARDEGVGGTPVRIEDVHGETTAANAMATGIGPSARVFIWDTFLDGRYSNREIEVVAAHEFGHIAHHHIWKGLAWSLLLTVPGFWLVELATRRRGGLERPEVVPLALLVLALIGLAITPLGTSSRAATRPRPTGRRYARPTTRRRPRASSASSRATTWCSRTRRSGRTSGSTTTRRWCSGSRWPAPTRRAGARCRCRAASRGGCGSPPARTTSTTSPASRRAARA